MRTPRLLSLGIAASLAIGGSLPGHAATPDAPGEKELAQLLEGRVPGAPRSCVRTLPSRAFEIIEGTAFVYRYGDTIWVNRPDGARLLRRNAIPVVVQFAGSGNGACEKDRVRMLDRNSRIPGGSVVLGEFVPWTRPAE